MRLSAVPALKRNSSKRLAVTAIMAAGNALLAHLPDTLFAETSEALNLTPTSTVIDAEAAPSPVASPTLAAGPRDLCVKGLRACRDLCPDTGILDDAIDLGGADDSGVCDNACAEGEKKCSLESEDRCGHFDGACRFHCEREAEDVDLCEDACDEGGDACRSSEG